MFFLCYLGSLTFTVMNMRLNYVFKYFSRVVTGSEKIVVESNLITVLPNLPLQGHLALTSDPSEMRYENIFLITI